MKTTAVPQVVAGFPLVKWSTSQRECPIHAN
jgi:hypothetical protein